MLFFPVRRRVGGAFTPTASVKKFVSSLLLFSATFAAQAQSSSKEAEVEKVFQWANPSTPGCVCAVSQNGETVLNRSFGAADLERGAMLDTNSVFDIASLRKQFIAAAVLMLAEEGKLSLSDDVRKYFPSMADPGHIITVNHLLTHTSGIRDWTVLLPLAGGKADVLALILRQKGLNFQPGEEWQYSNSNYVLLKEIVTKTAGVPLADFLKQRIFDPLEMNHTTYVEDLRSIIPNRALGYAKKGDTYSLDMLIDDERGGGGALFSTGTDLLRWNEALNKESLGKFVTTKLQEPSVLNNGRKISYARGLFVENNGGEVSVWHTGGAAGYHSWLGRLPEQGLSMAILCNSDALPASALANRVADLYLGAAKKTNTHQQSGSAEKAEVKFSTDLLDKKAGLYLNGNYEPLVLRTVNGRLAIVRGPMLIQQSDSDFKPAKANINFMSQAEVQIHFLSHSSFEIRSAEGEVNLYYKPHGRPAAENLQDYVGRYESSEVGNVFEAVTGKQGLVLRMVNMPENALPLVQVSSDVFQVGMTFVRFTRNEKGEVIGFDYSNPVIRHLSFRRQ